MNLQATAPFGIVCLGLLLGMRHATDPDHVVAVTTILSAERRFFAATRIGVVWGLGHTLTVLIVGAAIILFKLGIPVRLGLSMEFAVAIVLVLLGSGSAAKVLRMMIAQDVPQPSPNLEHIKAHSHYHVHLADGVPFHQHPHEHGPSMAPHQANAAGPDHHVNSPATARAVARRRLLKSFGVGLVHGLAGSAAIALMVLSAISQPMWATIYLAIFCVGTIIGMALITTAIGAPFMFALRRTARLHELLVMSSGLLSVAFGLFLAWRIGVTDHLFGSMPIWIPR